MDGTIAVEVALAGSHAIDDSCESDLLKQSVLLGPKHRQLRAGELPGGE